MSGLICAGNVFIDRIVSGVRTGEHGPINATAFSVNPGTAEKIDRISYKRDSFGQALDSVVFPGVSTLSIETDEADPEVLVYALLGTLSDVDAVSGTVTNESLTARSGRWIKTEHRDITNVVLTDDATPTPEVFDLNDDYTVDSTTGMIYIVPGGAIVDGEGLLVDYAYGALDSRQILAATTTEIRAFVRLDGKNLANQKKVSIICPLAVLTPSGELDVAGKEFISFGLSGTLVTDSTNGYTSPFIYTEID
jgi:hypothetical protein